MRLFWENANIGNTALQDLQVAKDNNDRTYLRLNTKTKNDKIYNFVDEARQNVTGISFDYNDTNSDSDFVDDIMDATCDVITSEFKAMLHDDRKTTNISPVLAEAIESFKRVRPKRLTITGYDNEVVILYEIEQNN